MRALYEIDNDILSCVNEETGEIDEERLSGLEQERERKVEGVALWVREIESDMTAYKVEEERFKAKRKQAKKLRESLKQWLVLATNGEKFHSAKVDVSFRSSKQLNIEDETHIPIDYYKTDIKKTVNKAQLKDDILKGIIKAPEGVEIVERLNTQVK